MKKVKEAEPQNQTISDIKKTASDDDQSPNQKESEKQEEKTKSGELGEGNQSSDEEDDDQAMEMLDMLYDGVQAEDHEVARKKQLQKMNEVMDLRLKELRMKKQDKKQQEMER